MLRLYHLPLVLNVREIHTFGLERGGVGKITGPSYRYRVQGIVGFYGVRKPYFRTQAALGCLRVKPPAGF